MVGWADKIRWRLVWGQGGAGPAATLPHCTDCHSQHRFWPLLGTEQPQNAEARRAKGRANHRMTSSERFLLFFEVLVVFSLDLSYF